MFAWADPLSLLPGAGITRVRDYKSNVTWYFLLNKLVLVGPTFFFWERRAHTWTDRIEPLIDYGGKVARH